jgi:hypothetical protein
MLVVLWLQNFYGMFFYQQNTITENTTTADLEKRGKVKLSEMKTIPFVAAFYKGK